MKTITINTPDELLSKWQEVATRLGIPLEELIVSSVEERLNKYSEIESIIGKTEQIKVVRALGFYSIVECFLNQL